MKSHQFSILTILLWLGAIGLVLGIARFDSFLSLLALVLMVSIPTGRKSCEYEQEWPKTSLLFVGAALYLGSLFGPVIFVELSPDWLSEPIVSYFGLILLVSGICLIRWNIEARAWTIVAAMISAMLFFALSVYLDITLHGLFPIPD